MMEVFKFGGASVKSADALINVANIIRQFKTRPLIIVISAMGKTTNAFEKLLHAYISTDQNTMTLLNEIQDYHVNIISSLFPDKNHHIHKEVTTIFQTIAEQMQLDPSESYDFEYDRLVSFGEILSSIILNSYLNTIGLDSIWLDARKVIITDNNYRAAKIDWKLTAEKLHQQLDNNANQIFVLAGFIGGTKEQLTTTLGREGSDFSAAIAAYSLDAEKVTIWKDVAGIFNADPAKFPEAKKIDSLSFRDAIELSYYGAKVIHPKTIKPLENKQIPLFVKSFFDITAAGTKISESQARHRIPAYIIKEKQLLITISSKDFSFIAENNLSEIFSLLHEEKLTINMMQNSAISFSIVLDNEQKKIERFIDKLHANYIVKYNSAVELITIWHYDEITQQNLLKERTILLEERNRYTIQMVVHSE